MEELVKLGRMMFYFYVACVVFTLAMVFFATCHRTSYVTSNLSTNNERYNYTVNP